MTVKDCTGSRPKFELCDRPGAQGWVTGYKQPARVVFWDELPKSGYGKVPKPLIRKLLAERGEDQVG